MNSFLAEMYGTRETIGAPAQSDDVEKLAEAQLIDEALRAENIDVDSLPTEAILKVATTLFGEDSALVKAAAAEDEHVAEGEAAEHTAEGEAAAEHTAEGESSEEKVAEADFLGRVMAHSFTQERAEIEKQADFKSLAKGGKHIASEALRHVKNLIGRAKFQAEHAGHWAKEPVETFKGGREFRRLAEGKKFSGGVKETLKDIGSTIKAHPGQAAVAGGALAAAGGGTAAAIHHHHKEASALDKLAEERALEILKENGVGQTEEEKLASAVEQRAWEMLTEQGYVAQE